MKEKKIAFTVEKIEEDAPRPNGTKILRVTIQCNDTLYTKAVRKADYLDEDLRKGIHVLWLKELRIKTAEDNMDKKEIKGQTDKLAALVGQGFEDV